MEEKQNDIKLTVETPATPEGPTPVVDEAQPQVAPVEQSAEPKEPEMSALQKMILEQTAEDDDDAPINKKNISLRKVLGGDILMAQSVRGQIGAILLATVFILVYIAQRYSCQKLIVEIDKLQKEVTDARYRSLSTQSDLTEHTRQSKILNLLEINKDSALHIADRPPFIITIPEGEKDNE